MKNLMLGASSSKNAHRAKVRTFICDGKWDKKKLESNKCPFRIPILFIKTKQQGFRHNQLCRFVVNLCLKMIPQGLGLPHVFREFHNKYLYGDGSKPYPPSVHIKIAGIYGCHPPKNGMYRYWSIAISYNGWGFNLPWIYDVLGISGFFFFNGADRYRNGHSINETTVMVIFHVTNNQKRPTVSPKCWSKIHELCRNPFFMWLWDTRLGKSSASWYSIQCDANDNYCRTL